MLEDLRKLVKEATMNAGACKNHRGEPDEFLGRSGSMVDDLSRYHYWCSPCAIHYSVDIDGNNFEFLDTEK